MTTGEKIINNCKKGLITIVKDKDGYYKAFCPYKDSNGNYRQSDWYKSTEETKQNIGECVSNYFLEDIDEYIKKNNWQIVEVYREGVKPFKVGDKVKILPSIEKTEDWEDCNCKKYFPDMKGEIMSVFNDIMGLRYCVLQENGEDYWYISHQYLAPLYEEVEEEVIKIGDKRYNKCEVEKALKNIKPL